MKLVKLDEEKAKKTMGQAFTIGGFATLLSTYVLAHLLAIVGPVSLTQALTYGVLLWLGLIFPMKLHSVAWAGRPLALLWIDTSHALAGILLTVTVLSQWPW
jgi:hypothetical protein